MKSKLIGFREKEDRADRLVRNSGGECSEAMTPEGNRIKRRHPLAAEILKRDVHERAGQ